MGIVLQRTPTEKLEAQWLKRVRILHSMLDEVFENTKADGLLRQIAPVIIALGVVFRYQASWHENSVEARQNVQLAVPCTRFQQIYEALVRVRSANA